MRKRLYGTTLIRDALQTFSSCYQLTCVDVQMQALPPLILFQGVIYD